MARLLFSSSALLLLVLLVPYMCSAAPNGDLAAALASAGEVKPYADISGRPLAGKFDANNHVISGTVGVGAPVWQSDNGRHSIGVGASASQGFAAFQGNRFQSQPSFGFGAGYNYRF